MARAVPSALLVLALLAGSIHAARASEAATPVDAAPVAVDGEQNRAAPHPIHVRDDRGHEIELPATPERIITLQPALTESVCAMGACGRLVGVDRYSDHPPQIRKLPNMGGGLDPNVEAIVALRPQVVLAATSSRAVQRLEALGISVIAVEPQTHADVLRVLQLLETLLQPQPQNSAQHIWQKINAGMDEAARSIPPQARGLRVYFEVSRGPYAAAPSSFIGESLQRLGLNNVVPHGLGPFPLLNPEFVLRADPDLIMTSHRSMEVQNAWPGWQQMRAVRQGAVCSFSQQDSDLLVHPGPRMDEAARLMAQCVRSKITPHER